MIVSFNLLKIRQNKTVVGAYHIDINSKTWLSVVRPCEKSKTKFPIQNRSTQPYRAFTKYL